jgi:hypothetical protein
MVAKWATEVDALGRPSLHRNATEGEGLLTYCCFNFREVRSEMQSRSLNPYEYARNLAGLRAKKDRASLTEPIQICTYGRHGVSRLKTAIP